MRLFDVLLIAALALLHSRLMPILLNDYVYNRSILLPTLGVVLLYFAIRCYQIFSDNYDEGTCFRASLAVDRNDVAAGMSWGIVIFDFYLLDQAALLFWLIIGVFIFLIGFLSGTVIHQEKGIRLTKSGRIMPWSEVEVAYINDFFFGFKTLDGIDQFPIVANAINYRAFQSLKKNLPEISKSYGFELREAPENSDLLQYEAHDITDDTTLDDFISSLKSFLLLTPQGILFSTSSKVFPWDSIHYKKMDEDTLMLFFGKNGISITQTFKSEDFKPKDWELLTLEAERLMKETDRML